MGEKSIKKWKIVFTMLVWCMLGLVNIEMSEVKANTYGDYEYSLINGGTEVKITGYSGSDTEIVIPNEIDGKAVTSIGARAFSGCCFSGELILPDALKSIGSHAFSDCIFDGKLLLPSGLESIGDCAFFSCEFEGEMKFPEGLTTIGEGAFCNSYGLTQLYLPQSVTAIGQEAFPESSEDVMVVEPGSYAEEYAKENGFLYRYENQLQVTIKNHYGHVVNKIFVNPGTTIKEPSQSEIRKGYTFLGFYKKGSLYDFSQAITEDIVLVERWKLNPVQSQEIPAVTGKVDNDYQTNMVAGGELGNTLDSKKTLWSFNQGKTEKVSDSVGKYFSDFVYGDDEQKTYWANYLVLNEKGTLSYYKKDSIAGAYKQAWSFDDVVDYTQGSSYCWDGHSYILLQAGKIVDSLSGKVVCENGAKLLADGLCITTDQKLFNLSTGQIIQDNVQYAWYGWVSRDVEEMDEKEWQIPDSELDEDGGCSYSERCLFVWGTDCSISYILCRQYENGYYDSHTIVTLPDVVGMIDENTGEIISGASQYAKCKDGTIWDLAGYCKIKSVSQASTWNVLSTKYAYRDGETVFYGLNENHELMYVKWNDGIFDLENIVYFKNDALDLIENTCDGWSVDPVYINTNYEVYNIDLDRVVAKNIRYINCYDGNEIMYITKENDLYIANCNYDEERDIRGTVTEDTFANSLKIMGDVKAIQVQKDFALITRTDGSVWSYSPTGVYKLLDGKIDTSADTKGDNNTQDKNEPLVENNGNEQNSPKDIVVNKVLNLSQKKIQKTRVTLTWDTLADVMGYEIYRRNYNSGDYKKVATIDRAVTSTYTDKNLKEASLYEYKIRAYKNVDGKVYYSEDSESLLANTMVKGTAVSKVKSTKKKQITITWKKVTGISGYELYRASKKNGKFTKVATISSKKTSYTDKKGKSKQKYYYKIRTYKKVGNKKIYSSYSKEKSVKVK